jgi:hypothetical protein
LNWKNIDRDFADDGFKTFFKIPKETGKAKKVAKGVFSVVAYPFSLSARGAMALYKKI